MVGAMAQHALVQLILFGVRGGGEKNHERELINERRFRLKFCAFFDNLPIAILTFGLDFMQFLHILHDGHCQQRSLSAVLNSLSLRRHVKWPRFVHPMQFTNRPFFTSARRHTMHPLSSAATLIVLRRLAIGATAVNSSSASSSSASAFGSALISAGSFAFCGATVAFGARFAFGTTSMMGIERRLMSTSDGSKTTFALRTRPLRPTDVFESVSGDLGRAAGSSSDFWLLLSGDSDAFGWAFFGDSIIGGFGWSGTLAIVFGLRVCELSMKITGVSQGFQFSMATV